MIYVTGDTHGDFRRFTTTRFPAQKEMSREDFIIICGDFGGVWTQNKSTKQEEYWLDWLENKPFTMLFVDGNHENFDRLYNFDEVDFCGGRAHKIRENVFHLMRGNIFDLCGKRVFAFGGASSHDIGDGILDPEDPDFDRKYNILSMLPMAQFRILNRSWWKQELPSLDEMRTGISNLEIADYKVDYVITHCLPQSVVTCLYGRQSKPDVLTLFFEQIIQNLEFDRWFCGHYHTNELVLSKYEVLYGDIKRIE